MVPGDQGTLVSLPGTDQGTFLNHTTGAIIIILNVLPIIASP
jgi:hypothetical protein